VSQPIDIRVATPDDAAVIARHRVEMFRDMGTLPNEFAAPLATAAERYFLEAIPRQTYVGWLASPAAHLGEVIGGAGIQVREALPRLTWDQTGVDLGPQGLIVNVYTERAWRRKGVAERLMQEVLHWTGARGMRNVVLHASAEGRALYEKLGFRPTNEMRYER
jgi:GNAT superfamily N-acetyltransferase